jgi:hypothetical protein
MNALKTAVDALRAVPLRLPSERLPEYGSRLRIWGLDKSQILKTAAAMVCAVTDEADRLGVVLLTETDRAANGSSRTAQRERMKLYMREKRASEKAASNANTDSRS